jgi:hypothetical protein
MGLSYHVPSIDTAQISLTGNIAIDNIAFHSRLVECTAWGGTPGAEQTAGRGLYTWGPSGTLLAQRVISAPFFWLERR